jgi:hypothetical protein
MFPGDPGDDHGENVQKKGCSPDPWRRIRSATSAAREAGQAPQHHRPSGPGPWTGKPGCLQGIFDVAWRRPVSLFAYQA